jgi:hypothetical protein
MLNNQANVKSFTNHAGSYRETVVGLTESEYRRQQTLARRPLVQADMPASKWDERNAELLLRDDGAIVPHDGDVVLGLIQDGGRVFWSLSYYAYHGLLSPALSFND